MKRRHGLLTAAVLVALWASRAMPLLASMGISGGYDLDKLWADARRLCDATQHDAVLLLEGASISIAGDGSRTTRVHRVVWIGTARGIHQYADLRIPYDSATSTLSVVALRTWRDGAWWPHESEVSETAVVETLPYAVALADDYTSTRETMLLHDGVELPCVMETIYEIAERAGADVGTDGHWVFPQSDPAVVVAYSVSIPSDGALKYASGNGVPEPEVTSTRGSTTYAWKLEDVDPLGVPHIANPAVYAPYVAWSTWDGWDAVGRAVASSFDEAAVVDDELAEVLAGRIEFEPSPASRARKVAALIDEGTRAVHHDSEHWVFTPRPAQRTWETAYGNGVDRAVMAVALFRRAGLDAGPIYHANAAPGADQLISGLSLLDGPSVWVAGDRFTAHYDPENGTVTEGPHSFGVVWRPGIDDRPVIRTAEVANRYEMFITLEPGADGGWKGRGSLSAEGVFSPHAEMAGLEDETLVALQRAAESVLPGAAVEGFNAEVFEHDRVIVGFEIVLDAAGPDARDRSRVVIGSPAGGVVARVPSDVHLYDDRRASPVLLPGAMSQRIVLRLKNGDRQVVHVPESFEMENETGSFSVSAAVENGWVTVARAVALGTTKVGPEAWPLLRALLLEETDPRHGTVHLK